MLRAGEAAQLLGVHVNTIRRWSDKGILISYHIGPRGDRRFRRVDLESFLKQGRQKEEELPTPRDLRGMVPDFTGDKTTEEYIRSLRE
jgi:excisionase family DNA binding protein